MKGLSIEFIKSGSVLDTNKAVEGFAALAQNGMVCIGCVTGSDPIFPAKGTLLYKKAVEGRISTYSAAYHASNFAALDTQFFLKESDADATGEERISKVTMSPAKFDASGLEVDVSFEGDQGTVIGLTTAQQAI